MMIKNFMAIHDVHDDEAAEAIQFTFDDTTNTDAIQIDLAQEIILQSKKELKIILK